MLECDKTKGNDEENQVKAKALSFEQFEAVFEAMPKAAVVCRLVEQKEKGQSSLPIIVAANRAACLLVECEQNELVGQTLFTAFAMIPKLVFRSLVKSLGNGEGNHQKTQTLTRDNESFEIELSTIGKRDLLVSLEDVSHYEIEREMYLNMSSKYRTIAESTNDWVFWVRPNGNVEYTSAAFEEMTGYSVFDVIRNPSFFDNIIHPDDLEKWRKHRDCSHENEKRHAINIRIITKSGEVRCINHTCRRVISNTGEDLGICSSNRDITSLEHSRREKSEMEMQLVQAQKMEAVGRLASGVAHDFNNLLTGMMGTLSLLLLDIDEQSEHHQSIAEVNEMCNRAVGLTKQLLSFSRKKPTSAKNVDINDIVRDTRKMLQRMIGEDIVIDILLKDSHCFVYADKGQIEQVLVNLAVNARDAMPKGGTLSIESKRFELKPEMLRRFPKLEAGRYVCISVTDSGVGMDEETKTRIFEPFFTTKDEEKGTGLGLATVYGIVQRHKGAIEVSSTPNEGTRFDIYLPEKKLDAKPLLQEDAASEPKRASVLLVEDDEMVGKITARMLRHLGYEVLSAGSAEAALGKCSKAIAYLVTDYNLPDMNGHMLARRLASRYPNLKIVMTSGNTLAFEEEAKKDNLKLRCLQKPFSPEELQTALNELTSKKGEIESP